VARWLDELVMRAAKQHVKKSAGPDPKAKAVEGTCKPGQGPVPVLVSMKKKQSHSVSMGTESTQFDRRFVCRFPDCGKGYHSVDSFRRHAKKANHDHGYVVVEPEGSMSGGVSIASQQGVEVGAEMARGAACMAGHSEAAAVSTYHGSFGQWRAEPREATAVQGWASVHSNLGSSSTAAAALQLDTSLGKAQVMSQHMRPQLQQGAHQMLSELPLQHQHPFPPRNETPLYQGLLLGEPSTSLVDQAPSSIVPPTWTTQWQPLVGGHWPGAPTAAVLRAPSSISAALPTPPPGMTPGNIHVPSNAMPFTICDAQSVMPMACEQ